MKVAVTGSRYGPSTAPQRVLFRQSINTMLQQTRVTEGEFELWHGACRGVDEFAHRLIVPIVFPGRVMIHALPGHGASPEDHPYRMKMEECDYPGVFVSPSAPYSTRNAELVKACDVLVACPSGPENHPNNNRSGTWQAVRMARIRRKPIVLVRPDGSIEIEGGTVNDSP